MVGLCPGGERPLHPPPREQNDTQVDKHYLPATSLAGGNKWLSLFRMSSCYDNVFMILLLAVLSTETVSHSFTQEDNLISRSSDWR